MRILFLTQVLPYPLDAGPKIRAYYMLRHLAQRHEVTLVSFIRSEDKLEHVTHLQTFCQSVHTVPMSRSRLRDAGFLLQSLLLGRPFIIARDTVPAMQTTVQRLLATGAFDVIHADQLWMAQYAALARKSRISSCRGSAWSEGEAKRPALVLDQHNAVYLIPQRLAQYECNPLKRLLLELEWRKLARYEADVCQQFDHIITVTYEDKQALLTQTLNFQHQRRSGNSQLPDSRFTTIPICVDPSATPVVERNPDARGILHLGTMFWPPNIEGVLWFAKEVLPLVQQQVPDVRFYVVGKNPPSEIRSLATHHSSLVTVTGYVDVDNVTPYIADSAVFIVSLHAGGGMRVKILDAWLWGIPVVSTSIGVEGLDIELGKNMLIADDAISFAQAVVNVLIDPALARRLRANGRKWVEKVYDWRVVYKRVDEVYMHLLNLSQE